MKHQRVIPRDFFNESKLLKCLGNFVILSQHLSPKLVKYLEVEENGEPFDIRLTESGELYCSNYTFTFNQEPLFLFTMYNNKSLYPLSVRINNSDTDVFGEDKSFTDEFISLLEKLKKR